MIENALGTFRRNQLFSFVYILQYDVASPVRQISWLMWKSVVTNTTRLLNSIINNLIDEIIHALSGSNADEQSAAASSLADLVKRNGDLLIPVIIPILQEGLSSPNESDRQGISAALAEIIESSGRNTMERHFLDFVPLVKCGICDTSFKTRQAAAHAFDALYRSKGKQIVTIIVKPLLEKLGINEESSTIFEGVREILRVRSGPILEELVPLLTADPFDSFQAQSLSSLVAVAGSELSLFIKKVTLKYLHTIDKLGIDSCQEHTDALRVVVSSLDMDSLLLVLGIFFDACIDKKTASSNSVLAAISDIMTHLFKTTEFDLSSQFSEALSCLISLYLSSDIRVQDSSVAALSALVNYGTPQNFVKYAAEIQELISTKTVNIYGYRLVEEIPGFVNVKNGIQPLLAVYQHGLMYGTQNEREKCASGIGQLVEYSNAESLKPYVIKITGPLIRIVGDRFDSSVKAAILSTLSSLLKKASTSMKPFVPQLQTTFLKSLLDESVEVRRCAVIGVSFLMKVNQRKLTSVLTELINRTSFEIDDEQTCGIVSSSIDACSEILRANSEVEVEDSILNSMFELVDTLRNSIHPSVRESIGVLFGMLSCISKNNSLVESALKNLVNVADLIEEADFHGAVVALGECAAYAPHIFTKIYSSAEKVFCKALSHESVSFVVLEAL